MEDVKILVVDDEARMRKLVKDFLSIKGFIVLEAEDGEEALKIFDSNKDIKLILLDVMMPKLDGFETLEVIRQYSKVPVMMLTEKKLIAGAIEIDKVARSVFIDEKPVDLSFKEYELLTYFIENKGIALSREKILNSVWNYDYFGDARTIDTHVKKLRAKMGERGDYIKTVWGMGYKFEITP